MYHISCQNHSKLSDLKSNNIDSLAIDWNPDIVFPFADAQVKMVVLTKNASEL